MQLLHPDCGRYLRPQLAAVAHPPLKEYSAAAMARTQHTVEAAAQAPVEAAAPGSDDEDEEGGGGGARQTSGPLGASKKSPEVRRRELLGSGAGSLAAALAELCTQRAGALIRSQHGSDVLVEVCRGGEGGLLQECLEDPGQLAAVYDALVAAVAGEPNAASSEGDDGEDGGAAAAQEPALSHFFGSRALRRLVLASSDAGPAGAAAAQATAKLWSGALAGRCREWVGTHAAKVLAALLQCGDAATKAAAAKELKPLVKGSLEEWAAKLTAKPDKQQAAAASKGGGKQKAAASATLAPTKRRK